MGGCGGKPNSTIDGIYQDNHNFTQYKGKPYVVDPKPQKNDEYGKYRGKTSFDYNFVNKRGIF